MLILKDLTQDEALDFFSTLYRGSHHLPSALKLEFGAWSVRHYLDIATFDYDDLTRLVFLAHERCVRASVKASGPRHLKVTISRRVHDYEQDMALAHPTLDEAVDKFKNRDEEPWWKIFSGHRAAARKE